MEERGVRGNEIKIMFLMLKLFSYIFNNKHVHILLFFKLFTALGQCLVKNKINLIYGGGNVGLMGTVAKTVADGGCQVTGFLPEFFVTRSKYCRMFSFTTNNVLSDPGGGGVLGISRILKSSTPKNPSIIPCHLIHVPIPTGYPNNLQHSTLLLAYRGVQAGTWWSLT